MPDLAIRTEALVGRHGNLIAVDHLALEVPRGAVYGFLGPNGAGKTSTIRMLLGLKRPHAGSIHVLGSDLSKDREGLLARIGALVEHPSLYPHLSAEDHLKITCLMRGTPLAWGLEALDLVELGEARRQRVKTFSLGMRQRLGLALAGKPELLILDEPTNGLDPAGMRDMRRLLATLSNTLGVTIFLSSHLLGEVEQVASHVGVLHRGRLRYQGTMEALKACCVPNLKLGVADPTSALPLLQALGCEPILEMDGLIRLNAGAAHSLHEAAALNAHLVQAGIAVHHLSRVEGRLEDLFLGLTEVA